MKDLFPEYYPPTEPNFEELWENCYFILDSSVLLDFYEYNEETQNDIFNTLEAFKERLWIPHQVALEYQINRTTVIKDRREEITLVIQEIETLIESLKNKITRGIKRLGQREDKFEKQLISSLNKALKLSEKVFVDNLPKIPYLEDIIRNKIDDLFKEKIGEIPSQEWLDKIHQEGEERYKQKIPPGFCDKGKTGEHFHQGRTFVRKYGDLIVWKEILQKIEAKNSRKYVIFITHDKKEDWWRKEYGQKLGPRQELIEEIKKAGAFIFHMYTLDRFLEYAKTHLCADIKDESIEEIETSLENDLNSETNLLEEEEVFLGTSSAILRESINNSRFEGMGIPPHEIIKEINSSLAPASKLLAEYEKSSRINSSALGQLSTNLQELSSLVKSPIFELVAAQEIFKKINGSLRPISAIVEHCEKLNQNNSRVLGQLSTNFTQLPGVTLPLNLGQLSSVTSPFNLGQLSGVMQRLNSGQLSELVAAEERVKQDNSILGQPHSALNDLSSQEDEDS